MDWNLFWSAFGAIGSTCGSLVTAIAVIVAIKQYKQPLIKKVRVNFGIATNSDDSEYYHIYIQNRGIRPVKITEIGFQSDKKKIGLNGVPCVLEIKLPLDIEQEEVVNFIYESEKVNRLVKYVVEQKKIGCARKVIVYAKDSFGEEYLCKTGMKINSLIKK